MAFSEYPNFTCDRDHSYNMSDICIEIPEYFDDNLCRGNHCEFHLLQILDHCALYCTLKVLIDFCPVYSEFSNWSFVTKTLEEAQCAQKGGRMLFFVICGFIENFILNIYFILQIYHVKSFKMMHVTSMYFDFSLRYS